MYRTLLSAASLVLALALTGCSDDTEATTGKRITLQTRISGEPESSAGFSNAKGWTIQLREAKLSVGALYYFDGAVLLAHGAAPSSPSRIFWRSLGVNDASAHPGHYIPGTAMGEALTGGIVDLRASVASLPAGAGVTGTFRSASFSFSNALPDGHAALLVGTATKGAETRYFRAQIDQADILNTKGAPAMEGCPFEEMNVSGNGTVTARVRLPVWFDQVEFSELAASSEAAPAVISKGLIAYNALTRGIKASDSYLFAFQKETP